MSLLSTYINPNLTGLATTDNVAAAQAAIDALVDADKQAVIDAISGMSSDNLATLLAAIAAIPSVDLQPVVDAQAEIVSAVEAIPAQVAGLPSGAIIRVQGSQPAPAGFEFLDSQVTNATEQGYAFNDAVAGFRQVLDAGLTVADNGGGNNALHGGNYSVAQPLVDDELGDMSQFAIDYDISDVYASAELISALFVPGAPSRLYFVLQAVTLADSAYKVVLLAMTADAEASTFTVETTSVLDQATNWLDFQPIWGSKTQCSFVAPSNETEGAQICVMRANSILNSSAWLVWELGATPNFRMTAGAGNATADTSQINRASVARVMAYSDGSFICVSYADSALRSRIGVYYDAANDTMAAAGVSLVVGVSLNAAVVRAYPAPAGKVSAFLAYTRLGFFEIRHGSVVDGFTDVSVQQTSARHPLDDYAGFASAMVYDGTDYVLVYFNNGGTGASLNTDYVALKAGFERKAIKS